MMSNLEFPERERRWRKIGNVFGVNIDVVDAEQLDLPTELGRLVVMRGIGGENGMVLFPSGSKVVRHSGKITSAGYGYSAVDPTALESDAELVSCESMLKDWGYKAKG